MKKKSLLMITWRDIKSPFAGGAEVLTHNILSRLTEKFEVTVLSSAFPKCLLKEDIDNIHYVRLGNKKLNYIGTYNWRIYFSVWKYYRNFIKNNKQFDVTIEQINNVPFFYSLYGNKKTIILIWQLCKRNWFYQVPFYLAWFGFLLFEPISLLLLKNKKIITISESTKNNLKKYGFKPKNISIIPVGIDINPVASISKVVKYTNPTILSLGNIRAMKRTIDQVKAFEIAKKNIPALKMKIAGNGNGNYFNKFNQLINSSQYKKDIEYLGKVSLSRKAELLKKSHLILSTSSVEGWGLIITEANSQGTPAVVYNVDGLRDSTISGVTGLVTQHNTPEEMAQSISQILSNKKRYKEYQRKAWEYSKKMNYHNSYEAFLRLISE